MITYVIIGMIWTLFFDWLLRTHGPDGKGLPTLTGFLLHTMFWPLAILFVIKNYTDKDLDN